MQFNCTMQYFLLEFDIGFANFVYKSVRGKMRKQFHFNNDQMRHVNTWYQIYKSAQLSVWIESQLAE